jgi:hypothetical protein
MKPVGFSAIIHLALAFLLMFMAAPQILPGQILPGQALPFNNVTGHDFGERITQSHEIVRYLQHLDAASDRVSVDTIGYSWDRRLQLYAVVTSPANHARIGNILENAQKLNDPRTTSRDEAAAIVRDQPAIVYLGGSIHGFELSGTEGLLKLLEHLTTRNDEETLRLLANTVVILDPVINPDGRDAFAQFNHRHTGSRPNPHTDDWNNDFVSWDALSFRTSHYYFDINRDWFAQTHPETRDRARVMQKWRPQVGVDAHEMGSDVEFYFDPPTDPVSPFFPEYTTRWFTEFGNAYAEAFDEAGFEYMTRERFNYFYPAYTTSYMSYQGAVGMLFEQGSTRGLAINRPDGTVRELADALEQQYVAALATVRLSADRREDLLMEYYRAHADAVADGGRGIRRYLIAPGADPNLEAELANLLMRSGVEVHKLRAGTTLRGVRDREGRDAGSIAFPAGTLVIEAAQPRNRFIRTLMEPSLDMPQDFLAVARERLDRGENPRFYDITAWSLPLMFNLNGYSTTDGSRLDSEQISGVYERPLSIQETDPAYAWLIDGRQAAGLTALYHLREKGYRGAVLLKPTRIEGREFASGTVILRVGQNDDTLHDAVRDAAVKYNLDISGVDTGHAPAGFPSLGSGDTRPYRAASVAIIAEHPVNGYSFGWAWHKLDRQYDIPVTVLRNGSIGSTPLDRFNVIVLPALADTVTLSRNLGANGRQRLQQWVRDGGTLVAIGGNSADYARRSLNLIRLRSWYDTEENRREQRVSVPGAFFRSVPDGESWLTAGYSGTLPVLLNSNALFLTPDGPPAAGRRTPVTIQEGDARISGHAWQESLDRVPGSVFAYDERVGRGRVVVFAEDVNFRGYWRGMDRLFLNAVILGPSAP